MSGDAQPRVAGGSGELAPTPGDTLRDRLPAAGREGAARAPAVPAPYTVIGGGCFGSFYVRQLLRYADRVQGPVERVIVIDRDPRCRVAREVSDPRVELVIADWADALASMLGDAADRAAAGLAIPDRLVPSPWASHVLLEALQRVAAPRARRADPGEAGQLFATIGTPFVRHLTGGDVALSFATWVCPVNCTEPPICPVLRQPLDWDMASAVANYALGRSNEVRSFHIVQCLHEAFGVGTIPVAHLAREVIRLRRAAERSGPPFSVIATVSTCHGLAGAIRHA
jgi:hypothetical protein